MNIYNYFLFYQSADKAGYDMIRTDWAIKLIYMNSLVFQEDLSLLYHTDRIWAEDTVTEK